MSLYQAFKCEETWGQFYYCQAVKINAVTSGKEQDIIVKEVSRYLYFATPNQYKDIDFGGRKASKVMIMFAYPADLLDLRVGMRFRFNLSKIGKKEAFNPNLKPFNFNLNIKDIYDVEIHSITPYMVSCDEPHIEITLVSYN